jgi:hypothetical protein
MLILINNQTIPNHFEITHHIWRKIFLAIAIPGLIFMLEIPIQFLLLIYYLDSQLDYQIIFQNNWVRDDIY